MWRVSTSSTALLMWRSDSTEANFPNATSSSWGFDGLPARPQMRDDMSIWGFYYSLYLFGGRTNDTHPTSTYKKEKEKKKKKKKSIFPTPQLQSGFNGLPAQPQMSIWGFTTLYLFGGRMILTQLVC